MSQTSKRWLVNMRLRQILHPFQVWRPHRKELHRKNLIGQGVKICIKFRPHEGQCDGECLWTIVTAELAPRFHWWKLGYARWFQARLDNYPVFQARHHFRHGDTLEFSEEHIMDIWPSRGAQG